MTSHQLHLFGGVRLTCRDGIIRNFGTVRAAKLLVLLSLARSGRMPRAQLAEQLWPGDFEDSTRLRLRQEIHRLRRALGAHAYLLGSNTADVWVDRAAVHTDIDRLERAAKGRPEGDLEPCLEAEFLPGWDDPWAVGERLKAAQLQLAAAIAQGTLWVESGHPDRALKLAQRLAAKHPVHEELRMVAVNAHVKLGNVAAAVAEHQDLRRHMKNQLGVEPQPLEQDGIAREATATSVSTSVDWSATIPLPLDPILGRSQLVAEVMAKLTHPAHRLVTLVGPGGVGKTRLAIELARQLVDMGDTRVAFVSMAEVHDPLQWHRTVLAQLRENPPTEANPLLYLARVLAERSATLVLDNAETVLPAAAEGVRALLAEAPSLTLLLTSVTPAKVPGEALIPVGRLDPSTFGCELLESALLLARPQSLSQPGVKAELLEISNRLDGYPLALKLASARLRLLSPRALLDQLGPALNGTGRSDLPERHRSLDAALSSSFSNLSDAHRATLEQIAAFPGGLSMEMAGIVFDGEPYLDRLETLLDSALVTLEDQEDPVRIRLLSPVRSFVQSQLSEASTEDLEHRAVQSIWSFVSRFDLAPWRPLPPRSLNALDAEANNLEFAWDWSCRHRPSWAFQSTARFLRYEIARGRAGARLEQFAELSKTWHGEPPEIAVGLELGHAFLIFACHRESQSGPPLERAQALAEQLDDPVWRARIALAFAAVAFRTDFYSATDRCLEALKLAERASDPYLAARVHKILGNIADFRNQPQLALEHLGKSYHGMFESDGGTETAATGVYYAFYLWHEGRGEEANAILEQSRTILEETREPGARAYLYEVEGRLAAAQGNHVEAERFFRESLRLWSAIGSGFQQADQNHSLSHALAAQGRWSEACSCLTKAADLWYQDNNLGGLCCSISLLAAVLQHQGNTAMAKNVLAFALDLQERFALVLVQVELDRRARLLEMLAGPGVSEWPLTLEAGHSLFDLIR